jgi:hypothetical protein
MAVEYKPRLQPSPVTRPEALRAGPMFSEIFLADKLCCAIFGSPNSEKFFEAKVGRDKYDPGTGAPTGRSASGSTGPSSRLN